MGLDTMQTTDLNSFRHITSQVLLKIFTSDVNILYILLLNFTTTLHYLDALVRRPQHSWWLVS